MSTMSETTPIESRTASGPTMTVSSSIFSSGVPACSSPSFRQAMTMLIATVLSMFHAFELLAPPSDRDPLGPGQQRVFRNVLGDCYAGTDDRACADRHSRENHGTRAEPHTIAHDDRSALQRSGAAVGRPS